MKTILIAVVMAIGVGGILFAAQQGKFGSVSVENNHTVETVEVEVETLQRRITDAQEAAKADIETKAKAAYDKAVSQALLEVELEVREAYRKELEATEKELQKQSISY